MARLSGYVPLCVYLNGHLFGQSRKHAGGAIDFRYAPDWLGWEHALRISCSLPPREDRYVGAPVIAVFENLLPDSERIRRRVVERMRAEGPDVYGLLAATGRDGVGALQCLPMAWN